MPRARTTKENVVEKNAIESKKEENEVVMKKSKRLGQKRKITEEVVKTSEEEKAVEMKIKPKGRPIKTSNNKKIGTVEKGFVDAEESSTASTSMPKASRASKQKKNEQNGDVKGAPNNAAAVPLKGRKRQEVVVLQNNTDHIENVPNQKPEKTPVLKDVKPTAANKRARPKRSANIEPGLEPIAEKKAKKESSEATQNRNRGRKLVEKKVTVTPNNDNKNTKEEKVKKGKVTKKEEPEVLKKTLSRKRTAAKLNEKPAKENDDGEKLKPSNSKKALLNPTETTYNKADFELPATAINSSLGNLSNVSNISNGGDHHRTMLKISSWNVAGLRSWLKKDGLKYLEFEEPDIFCMQEIKCTSAQLPEEASRIPGYHPYWLCKTGGYAGVALYSKIMPIHVDYGIGNEEFDSAGRIITAEYEKFFLINVYVPNSGRKLVNLQARMRWEKIFQAHVKKLDSLKPVIIAGDMNVSHQEMDLANPKSNTRSAGFTIEEREKMTELLELGFIDTFRHLYPDKRGAYTYWTYIGNARSRNVGWRLDYFLVSERILKRVVESEIRSHCKGSDHCPITLFINN